MNILITGSTGFIGKALSKKLEKKGHTLFFTTREKIPNKHSFNIMQSSHEELVEFLKAKNVDCIIHLASLFLVNHTPKDVQNLIESNITFPTLLLEAAKHAEVKWFLNTGTFWQHYQNEIYNPVNLYAATKQAFEDVLKYYSETCTTRFLTLEISDTFGPHDERGKIFNKWMKVKGTDEELNMSPGEQMIDILYIEDVTDAYLHALDHLQLKTTSAPEKYSLYSKKAFSLKEMAHAFDSVFKSTLKIKWGKLPYRDREVLQTWNKGMSLPGWAPKRSFEEGCLEILKVHSSKP